MSTSFSARKKTPPGDGVESRINRTDLHLRSSGKTSGAPYFAGNGSRAEKRNTPCVDHRTHDMSRLECAGAKLS